MRVKIIDGTIEHDNKLYTIGEAIDINKERATELIEKGYCEECKDNKTTNKKENNSEKAKQNKEQEISLEEFQNEL